MKLPLQIDHLRVGESALVSLLKDSQVLGHPFVSGELACGNLANRALLLNLIGDLPQAPLATQEEVVFFIEHHKLMGRGIGFIDAHLLAST
ncbi:MAG: VapC toxin family PIN domain ribonuclease, partial [Xanthomonadales bacterium]|nr:VapC toxin family PIN domain ribonuclease [Xanthomonadales bacterium]